MTDGPANSSTNNFQEIKKEEIEIIKKRRWAALLFSIRRINKKLEDYIEKKEESDLGQCGAFLQKLKKNIEDFKNNWNNEDVVIPEALVDLEKSIDEFENQVSTNQTKPNNLDKRLDKILDLSKNLPLLYENWKSTLANGSHNSLQTCGLALSGGGIRSATFNLGLLQALDGKGALSKVDYLSTVSGGGYIGSSLTYNLNSMPLYNHSGFPFERGNKVIRWIRRHASYLVPGAGLNQWALIAAVLRGVFINLIIIIPLLVMLMWVFKTDYINADWASEFLGSGKASGIIVFTSFFVMFWFRVILFERYQYESNAKPKLMDDSLMLLLVGIFLGAFSILYNEIYGNRVYEIIFLLLPILFVALAILYFFITDIVPNKIKIRAKNTLQEPFVRGILKLSTWLPAVPVISFIQRYLPGEIIFPIGYQFLFLIGCGLLTRLVIANLYYAFLSFVPTDRKKITFFSIQYGDYLLWGSLFIIIGSIPVFYSYIPDLVNTTIASILATSSIFSIVLTAIGWIMTNKSSMSSRLVNILLMVGIPLLLFSGLIWIYHLLKSGGMGNFSLVSLITFGIILLIIWITLVISTDINHVSMHRFYRNRLVEAFFRSPTNNSPIEKYLNELYLKDIMVDKTGAPYPIINTNIVTVGSDESKLANRLGDCFIFSPKYIGSGATGWVETTNEAFKKMNLGTAMAVSGAAVDPNIGETKSWPLRVLMGLLNVRLGYWMVNPNMKPQYHLMKLWRESWLWLISREIFGFPNEKWRYIRLSDGGHFENLGLYELVRRKCKVIIVSDAGADPDWLFGDLSRAIQRARVDFEADIEIKRLSSLVPGKNGKSLTPFVTGTIKYQDGTEGQLIYLKSTLFKRLPEDVLGYARKNNKFPDEPTANQFFTEDQFEAYRILGYHAGIEMINKEANTINNC